MEGGCWYEERNEEDGHQSPSERAFLDMNGIVNHQLQL
jgi:hypothetical protein